MHLSAHKLKELGERAGRRGAHLESKSDALRLISAQSSQCERKGQLFHCPFKKDGHSHDTNHIKPSINVLHVWMEESLPAWRGKQNVSVQWGDRDGGSLEGGGEGTAAIQMPRVVLQAGLISGPSAWRPAPCLTCRERLNSQYMLTRPEENLHRTGP